MSALERMVVQQLTKNLPPDTAKWFTPEGLKQLGNKVGEMALFVGNAHKITMEQGKAILANQEAIMEHLGIHDRYNSGPKYTLGGDASGSGDTEQRSAA